jgi:hypothetical protein
MDVSFMTLVGAGRRKLHRNAGGDEFAADIYLQNW